MNERGTEKLLSLIRSLISLSAGMVVALLVLSLTFWLQSNYMDSFAYDQPLSIAAFLVPFFFGGLAAGAVNWTRNPRVALLHGLVFTLVYLAIFLPGWLTDEHIGPGLITGLLLGGGVLGLAGSLPGFWLRQRLLPRQ